MLEKNKDYIEMRVSSTDFAFVQNKPVQLCVEGSVDATNGRVPGPGEDCIIVSKEKFEQLQTENEQLKKKLQVPDPFAEYKEMLKKLNSAEDAENLEWVLNHTCGGQASVNGWMVTAKLWRQNYETLSKLVGFSSVEEIKDYLTNEAECDTLNEAISKLHDQVKYTCEEWYSANSSNNSWKAAAECNTPKELIKKREALEKEIADLKKQNDEFARKNQDLIDDSCGRKTVIEAYKRDIERWQKATCCSTSEEAKELISSKNGGIVELKNKLDASLTANERLKKEIGIYSRALNEWKEGTGCPSPSAAKTLIESGASWMTAYRSSCEVIKTWKKLTGCPTPIAAKTLIESGMSYEHGYHEVQEENRKLTDDINSWKNVTGHSTPEDYLHARIHCATPFDYTAAWQKATGCNTPEEAKNWINQLDETAGSLNKELLSWYKATGCGSPEAAEAKIKHYKSRLGNAVQAASVASKHLDTITV